MLLITIISDKLVRNVCQVYQKENVANLFFHFSIKHRIRSGSIMLNMKAFFFKMEALHWSWMHCVVPIIFMLNLETLKLEALCWCWKHCVEPGSMGFNYLALVWTLKSFELILEALCWNWRHALYWNFKQYVKPETSVAEPFDFGVAPAPT